MLESKSNFKPPEFQTVDFSSIYDRGMSDTLPAKGTWHLRLKAALDEKGWTKTDLHRRSGVGYDSINKYLRGDVDQPRGDTLARIARALEVDELYLREGLRPGPVVSENATPVRGRVGAGIWLEVGRIDDDPIDWLPFNPFPEYPKGSVFALVVDGDSIDRIAPDGATIICTDLGLTGYSLREDDIAIVERRLAQDSLREVTAKRVKREAGELWLVPESNNPKWQTTKMRMADLGDDGELRLVARLEYVLSRP